LDGRLKNPPHEMNCQTCLSTEKLLPGFPAPGSVLCLSFECSPLFSCLEVELNPTVQWYPDREKMTASSPCSCTGSLLPFLSHLFALKPVSLGTFWVIAPQSRACSSAHRPCTIQPQMPFLTLGCTGITSGWAVTTWPLSNLHSLHTSNFCMLATCHTENSNVSSAFVYYMNSRMVCSLRKEVSVLSRLFMQIFNGTEPRTDPYRPSY